MPNAAPPLTILHSGTVRTMTAPALAQAVALRGDTIVAVGANDEILSLAGPGTRRVDLGGRTVLPGIHDGHIHFTWWALRRSELQLREPTSVPELCARVGEHHAAMGDRHGWLVGHGWSESTLADVRDGRRPHRDDLDAITAERPVVLVHFSEHAAWVNSAALAAVGIDRHTPDPAGGHIVRDADGEPTGMLHESAIQLVLERVPPVTPTQAAHALRNAATDLIRDGVTSVTDGASSESVIAQYHAACRQPGGLGIRVGLLWHAAGLELPNRLEALREAYRDAPPPADRADRWLRVAGAKLFADGVPALCTAWTSVPYHHGCTGGLLVDGDSDDARRDHLTSMIGWLHGHRFNVQVHVTGDRACDAALDGMEAAQLADPWPQARHVLVHANLVSDAAIARMAAGGISANVNSLIKREMADRMAQLFNDGRAEWTPPCRAMLDAGVNVADTSDAPVVAPHWRQAVHQLVTRRARHSGRVFGAVQAISVEEALRCWTLNAARQEGADGWKGSIARGRVADLTVLDADPVSVDVEALADIGVSMTWIGGELVHEA